MLNTKALSFTVKTLLARLKFQTEFHNDRQDKNNIPPIFDLRGKKNIWPHKIEISVLRPALIYCEVPALQILLQF